MATLLEYRETPSLRYRDSSLCATHLRFVPRDAQEALLESVDRDLFPLSRLPPRVAGYEWFLTKAEMERAIRGALPQWMQQGKRVFGPIEEREAHKEFSQLLNVFHSIEQHGLRESLSTDPIRGFFLLKGDHYRFVLTGGQHRVAALRVLGETAVEVRLDWLRSVDEDELYRWTARHGGPYTDEVVCLMFNRQFAESGLTKAKNVGVIR